MRLLESRTRTSMGAKSFNSPGFIIMTNGDRGFDEIITKVVRSEPTQRFLPVALGA